MPKRKQCTRTDIQAPSNFYQRYPRIGFIGQLYEHDLLTRTAQQWLMQPTHIDFYWFSKAEPIVDAKTRFPKDNDLDFYANYIGFQKMTVITRCLRYFGNAMWTCMVYVMGSGVHKPYRAIALIVDTPLVLNKWHTFIQYGTSFHLNQDIIFIVVQYLIPESIFIHESPTLAKTQAQVPFFIGTGSDYFDRFNRFLTQSDQGSAFLAFFEKNILKDVLNVSENSLLMYGGLVGYFRFIASNYHKKKLQNWAEEHASAWLPSRISW